MNIKRIIQIVFYLITFTSVQAQLNFETYFFSNESTQTNSERSNLLGISQVSDVEDKYC